MRIWGFLVFLSLGFLGSQVHSAEAADALIHGARIALWPDMAPGTGKVTVKQEVIERSKDPKRPDRAVIHVTRPELVVHRPSKPNGTAAVIAPGGGYHRVVVDKEGPDTSAWLNGLGVTTFILFYRLPVDSHVDAEDVALQDAQRAIRYVRSQAGRWELDPKRIGFVGYSAGGHLGAAMAAFHDKSLYQAVDEKDALSARPDFVILGYPVAGWSEARPANRDQFKARERTFLKYRIEAPTTAAIPPTFIFHADDDPVLPPVDSHRISRALRAAGGSIELHIFRTGGHGFGIRDAKGAVTVWPELCASWLRGLGLLRQ